MDRPLDSLINDLQLPSHRAVAGHWLGLYARDHAIPVLADIDPLQFPRALADAWIVDATDDGHFCFRLMGENLVAWYGRNPKGQYYEDLFPPMLLPLLTAQSRRVIDQPCAGYHRVHTKIPEWTAPRCFERLTFPLRDSDGRRRHILGISVFNLEPEGDSAPDIDYWYPIG
jgi:hypothetical protein